MPLGHFGIAAQGVAGAEGEVAAAYELFVDLLGDQPGTSPPN
jgi:hypothetical protein